MRPPIVRSFLASSIALVTAASSAAAQPGVSRSSAPESPFTVGRGRVQVDVDMFSRSVADKGVLREYVWNVGVTTASIGISRSADLRVSYRPYSEVALTDPGMCLLSRTRGAGDVTVGGKYAFLGANGGSMALAIVGQVTLPTARQEPGNGHVEASVAVPFQVQLGNGFVAGSITTVELAGATAERTEGLRMSQAATLGRRVSDRVTAVAVISGQQVADAGGSLRAVAGGGVTIGITRNLQMNGGASVGLSGGDQSKAYLGFTVRR